MSDARNFGELFANPLVRHSVELAGTLWGLSPCIVDSQLRAHFPVVAPEPISYLYKGLLSHKQLRPEFELHFSPLLVASADWSGPRWSTPIDGVRTLATPVGSTSGVPFLLCVPFVLQSENENAERKALGRAIKDLKVPQLKTALEFVPVLSPEQRHKVQTHMSTLGREMDLLLTRRTRRSDDTRAVREGPARAGVLGASELASSLRHTAKRLATENFPVLLQGPLGSGKRKLAQAVHNLGPQRSQPFLLLDCQTMPVAELTAAFLGDKGSGRAELNLEGIAAQGTVVFHEVSFLPPHLQYHLLKYCDELDSKGTMPFRILATTSYSVDALLHLGTLRPELLNLLSAKVVSIPPLTARKGDIPEIAADMLHRLWSIDPENPQKMHPDVVKALQTYEWPGNLWELKAEIRHLASSGRGRNEAGMQDLSNRIIADTRQALPESIRDSDTQGLTLPEAVENLEKSLLTKALSATKWNKSQTARILGVSRRNLIRKITRYQLDRRKRLAVTLGSESMLEREEEEE